MVVRLLHTADVHLGRHFPSLRNKGGEYRQQLLRTFERIVDLAVSENVSLLLIAGDLLDSNRVHGLTIGKLLSLLAKLQASGIRVCIIPGTHDAYGDDSVYRSLTLPQNVVLFTPEHRQQSFEDLGLTVYGMVAERGDWGKSPLQGLSLDQASKFHVGMAHCSVRRPGVVDSDAAILDADEIARSGLDYLALGHWHSFQDFSQGKTAACYSGSPEPLDIDQKGAGNVVMVTLYDKEKAEVRPIQVGTRKCESMPIDVSSLESPDGVRKAIEARADPNLFLDVTLTGLARMDCDLDCQEMENMLGGKFFHLRVTDRSHPQLEQARSQNYPEKTVAGRFLRIAEEKIATASTEADKALYEEALRLGFALLQGHSQVIE